ncbi:hypothetical protein [Gemmatimonas sp.]|uniref:hypothetical protein n=1 Tax=Gemmatimonas sp. TaxID=1962908 RepID=UPI00286DAD72|nr:hypothetical protein [Gemmatimonas sp.]
MTSIQHVGALRTARVTAIASMLGAGVLSAQSVAGQSVDPRFQPWMGCWTPSAQSIGSGVGQTPKPPSMACVVPSATIAGSVDLVVFDSANVATRAAVPLPGTRMPKSIDGCTGTETATWMPDERRLLMQAELSCGRGAKRLETGLMTMSSAGEWMQVQHLDVGGNSATSVMTLRYVVDSLGEWARLGASSAPSTPSLRLAVGAPLLNSDVLAVAKRAPAALTEAWLTETRQQFSVNGKELVRLADGGMPPRVIDLMIAISNPETFAVRTPSADRSRPMAGDVLTGGISSSRLRGGCRRMDDFCYGPGGLGAWGLGWQYGLSPFDPYSLRYGYGGLYSPYGFGNGYYPGNTPVIIVNRGDSDPSARVNLGRAVRGAGYTRANSGGSSSPAPSSIFGGSSQSGSSGAGSSGPSGSGTGAGSSSGGGDAGRTAKPRGSGGN